MANRERQPRADDLGLGKTVGPVSGLEYLRLVVRVPEATGKTLKPSHYDGENAELNSAMEHVRGSSVSE